MVWWDLVAYPASEDTVKHLPQWRSGGREAEIWCIRDAGDKDTFGERRIRESGCLVFLFVVAKRARSIRRVGLSYGKRSVDAVRVMDVEALNFNSRALNFVSSDPKFSLHHTRALPSGRRLQEHTPRRRAEASAIVCWLAPGLPDLQPCSGGDRFFPASA